MQGGGVSVDGSADFVNCNIFNNEASGVVRARILNFWTLLPAPPRWNVSRLIAYFCMQGGGVAVLGSANFINCNLFDNEATYVRSRILNPLWTLLPAPRWNVTRLIAYFCMQGGGVFIDGSADFTGCNIFNNKVYGSVRARILNLLEPSSSAPLNSDTLRCFDTQTVGARILNFLDPSSSAPLERYATDCIILHAGRWGPS